MEVKILSGRESEVFELLVQNKTTKEIAELLFIKDTTVRNHISNVIKKLDVKGRAQAIYELVRLGEIQIEKKGTSKNSQFRGEGLLESG